jgi:hypothetical protein
MAYTRSIDNALYSRKALADARSAYAQYCTVRGTSRPDGLVDVTVEVKADYAKDKRQVTLEFWNFFLDTACQQRLEPV